MNERGETFKAWTDRPWSLELVQEPGSKPIFPFTKGQVLVFSEAAKKKVEIKDPKKGGRIFDCAHDEARDQVALVIEQGEKKLFCDISRVRRTDGKKDVLVAVFTSTGPGPRRDEEIGSWVAVDGQGIGPGAEPSREVYYNQPR